MHTGNELTWQSITLTGISFAITVAAPTNSVAVNSSWTSPSSRRIPPASRRHPDPGLREATVTHTGDGNVRDVAVAGEPG
ncbi:hypothetical protein [Streptomyces sp900105755]|uniref:Uncharacterized protein n=1 Tax=Streptomyces sp. 900105755 TaxID=3154389 RepID=A0ABV1TAU4_9ACTN